MTRISALVSVVSISLLLSSCTVRFVSRDENGTMGQGQQDAVWVCHGNQNPRWHAVAEPAADAHRRHGDAVSDRPREEGSSCGNVDRRTDDDRGGDDDHNGNGGGTTTVWVCHGNQNPRWISVAEPAADAHRRHGDAVSSRRRATNSPCGAPDRRTDEGRDQDEDEDRNDGRDQGRDDTLWVCHGNQNPRWMSLPSSAADAHRRHGDPVSARPRDGGSPCVNGKSDRNRNDDEARGQGQDNRPDHAQGQGQDRGRGQGQGRDEARGQGQDRDQGDDRGQGRGRDEARGQGQGPGGGQGAGPGDAPDEARGQDQDRGQANGQAGDQGREQEEARGQDQGRGQGQGQPQDRGRDQGADEVRDRGQGNAPDREEAQRGNQDREPDEGRDEAEPADDEESFVWICHGNRNPRWQKVLAARADAHRRHGDRISSRPQEDGARCQERLH